MEVGLGLSGQRTAIAPRVAEKHGARDEMRRLWLTPDLYLPSLNLEWRSGSERRETRSEEGRREGEGDGSGSVDEMRREEETRWRRWVDCLLMGSLGLGCRGLVSKDGTIAGPGKRAAFGLLQLAKSPILSSSNTDSRGVNLPVILDGEEGEVFDPVVP